MTAPLPQPVRDREPTRRRRVLAWILPIAILSAAGVGFAALKASKPVSPPVASEEKAWRVSAMAVEPGPQVPELMLYGNVEAPRQAELRAAISADVVRVDVVEGQTVQAGQELVGLDRRDITLTLRSREADLAEAEADIASEQRRYETDLTSLKHEKALLRLAQRAVTRAVDLSKKKMTSQAQVDESRQALERQALTLTERQRQVDDHPARLARLEARRDRTRALLDQAKLDLSRTRIQAPFDGRITSVPVAPGDRVRNGDPVLTLYPLEGLEIRAQIPFRALEKIRQALAQGVPLKAHSTINGQPLTAVLDRLAGETAHTRGGVDGLFRIDDSDNQKGAVPMPGRLVSMLLALPAEADTIAVPLQAVYGMDRIYRLQGERMQGLKVEQVGQRRRADGEALVLVRNPELAAGDRIITTALPNAVSGLKVTVVEPDPAIAAESPTQPKLTAQRKPHSQPSTTTHYPLPTTH